MGGYAPPPPPRIAITQARPQPGALDGSTRAPPCAGAMQSETLSDGRVRVFKVSQAPALDADPFDFDPAADFGAAIDFG